MNFIIVNIYDPVSLFSQYTRCLISGMSFFIYIFLKIQEMGNLDNYLTRFISSNVGN
jgi:hypothetical protein